MQEVEFEIDRSAVEKYFHTVQSLACLLLTFVFGIGIILALIHYYKFGRWLCPQQANALRYRIEGNKLRVDSGVFCLFRRSIPLERITDIVLFQNPIQRHFGVWVMQVHTAGFASNAIMCGVCEPEKVREIIFAQRQSVYVGDVVCTPPSPHPAPLANEKN